MNLRAIPSNPNYEFDIRKQIFFFGLKNKAN